MKYVDAAWQLVGAVGLCVLIGWWLDKRFGTRPWFLVGGAGLGFVSGMWALFKVALPSSRTGPSRNPGKGPGGNAKDQQ